MLVTTNTFAQEITGYVRTEDKYSIAVRNTITEYLENKFTTFDEAYADNVVFNLNGNQANKAAVKQGWEALYPQHL